MTIRGCSFLWFHSLSQKCLKSKYITFYITHGYYKYLSTAWVLCGKKTAHSLLVKTQANNNMYFLFLKIVKLFQEIEMRNIAKQISLFDSCKNITREYRAVAYVNVIAIEY